MAGEGETACAVCFDPVSAQVIVGASLANVQRTMDGDRWLSELVRAEETKSFLQVSMTGALGYQIAAESGAGKARNTASSGT